MKTNTVLRAFFSSETRIRILSHYFLHPGESFYVRQLEKILEIPVGQLSPELRNLEGIHILSIRHEGNQKHYALNREFPLYDELRGIFLKTGGAAGLIGDVLSPHKEVELAFIYGSFAKGEEHEKSDIDLMVVGAASEATLHRSISRIERALKRAVNYSLYERGEVKSRLRKKDNFITTVFREPHILAIGQESDELFQSAP
jgi:predicted nucleotidyltransferase